MPKKKEAKLIKGGGQDKRTQKAMPTKKEPKWSKDGKTRRSS